MYFSAFSDIPQFFHNKIVKILAVKIFKFLNCLLMNNKHYKHDLQLDTHSHC